MLKRALLLSAGFLACACTRAPASVAGAARGAPVVLISIDTLRSDHLPAYGYDKVQTPNIDALRHDAILFERAYSHVPLTLPSHASMLTGLLPFEHGVRDNLGYELDAAKHPTLASLLKAQGYATGAAVSAYVIRGQDRPRRILRLLRRRHPRAPRERRRQPGAPARWRHRGPRAEMARHGTERSRSSSSCISTSPIPPTSRPSRTRAATPRPTTPRSPRRTRSWGT